MPKKNPKHNRKNMKKPKYSSNKNIIYSNPDYKFHQNKLKYFPSGLPSKDKQRKIQKKHENLLMLIESSILHWYNSEINVDSYNALNVLGYLLVRKEIYHKALIIEDDYGEITKRLNNKAKTENLSDFGEKASNIEENNNESGNIEENNNEPDFSEAEMRLYNNLINLIPKFKSKEEIFEVDITPNSLWNSTACIFESIRFWIKEAGSIGYFNYISNFLDDELPELILDDEIEEDSIDENNFTPLEKQFKIEIERIEQEQKLKNTDEELDLDEFFNENICELNEEGHIEEVSINGIPNSKIPKILYSLPYLASLSYYNCELKSFPDELMNCNNLKELAFINNGITEIPNWIERFINLENFVIEGELIKNFPESTKMLRNLKRLSIYNDEIAAFINILSVLDNLINLKELILSKISLKSIQFNWENLKNLEHLELTNCELEKITDSFKFLKSLNYLDLSSNPNLQIENCLNELYNLKEIYLLKCGLNSIPKTIFSLNSLEVLSLDSNNISKIPIQITELKRLESIRLCKNPIKEFPVEISEMENLYQIIVDPHIFKQFFSIWDRFESKGIAILNEDLDSGNYFLDESNFFSDEDTNNRLFIKKGEKNLIQRLKSKRRELWKRYGVTGKSNPSLSQRNR